MVGVVGVVGRVRVSYRGRGGWELVDVVGLVGVVGVVGRVRV